MAGTGPANVNTAFEILLEEMKAHIESADQAGAVAFQRGDYDSVSQIAARAKAMKELLARATRLRDEWGNLGGAATGDPAPAEKPRRPRRVQRGLRLHTDEYRVPLLTALAERGGRAPKADVLKRVEELLRSRLEPIEYTPVPSGPDRPR